MDENLHERIFRIRGHHVMLGPDLGYFYKIPTKVLMQAVRRNLERFPPDFMFQLTWTETTDLLHPVAPVTSTVRSQSVTLRRHARFRPFAFTEEGVAMLSAVLHSHIAIRVSIAIIRTFVKLRRAVLANRELGRRIEKIEGRLHITETDVRLLRTDIQELKQQPGMPNRKIRGFEP